MPTASPPPGAALGGTETAVALELVGVILCARWDADGERLGCLPRHTSAAAASRQDSEGLWGMERMTKAARGKQLQLEPGSIQAVTSCN